jgi:hypothetical protein
LAKKAVYQLENSSVPEMSSQFMYVYDFLYGSSLTAEAPGDLGRVYYAPGIGEVYARSSWDKTATWVNLIGGPYTESHAHQDQGSIMLYKGGWLAYDPVVESSSGLTQDVDVHNLVRVTQGGDTLPQREGTSTMMALHRGAGWLHAAVDTKPVYRDDAVTRMQREMVYLEPDCVVVFDRVATAAGTSQIWQLSSPVSPTLSAGRAVFAAEHTLTVDTVLPAAASRSIFSWTDNLDFHAGFRFDETVAGGDNRFLHVLSVDGAVSSVAGSDTAGRHGVIVQLADGRTATVRFSDSGVDGTLEISGGSGDVTATLGPGIDSLPE